MKRHSDTVNTQVEKRPREVMKDEEIELRDKFLDECSSKLPFHGTININKQRDDESYVDNENQELRKIIKLEGSLPNLALPDGWIALNHMSGGIVYLHRETRVCTWARPYHLGKGSVKKHDVPVAAIPCLHQKKALNTKYLQTKGHQNSETQNPSIGKGSILNFLNTAGTADNQIGQGNDAVKGDITSTKENNIDSHNLFYTQNESCADEKNTMNNTEGNKSTNDESSIGSSHGKNEIACSDGNYGDYKHLDGDDTHGKIVDNGTNSNHGYNKIFGAGSNHVNNEIDVAGNNSNVFCPKSGLDVVNETLRVYSESTENMDKFAKDSHTEMQNSKADFYSKILQDESIKTKESEKFYKMPEGANGFKVDKDASLACNVSAIKTTTESENSSSSEDQSFTDSKNCAAKSQQMNILSGVHQNSGIELIDAQDLSTYFGQIFEFEKLTVHQEQNVITTSTETVEETPLSAALECLPYCVKGKTAKENKGWALNPGGKTPVTILHEYSQAVLKGKLEYVYSECENGAKPFMVEIQINGITYGTGMASSKKQAKQIAAEAALEVFMPGVFNKIRDYVISGEELECFDKLKIDDPKVYEISNKSGLPTPSQVLQECLKRNQGVCSSTINFKIVPGEGQNHMFKISCGKHSAEGFCKNKKIGKQLAYQAILTKLHPHITTWGSLLRIYCDRPSSIVKKYKRSDEDSLTHIVSSSSDGTPRGTLLLERLKEEMRKLADKDKRPDEKNLLTDRHSISTVDI